MVSFTTYVLSSLVVATGAFTSAYYEHQQFYPAIVFLVESKLSNLIFGNCALIFVLLLGKLIKSIFLGALRDPEIENVRDRMWATIMDTLLAMTTFHDEFGFMFFIHFGLLLATKSFHWLVADRVEYLARGSHHTFGTHLRLMALMSALGILDSFLVYRCALKALQEPSMMILFSFEYTILSISIVGLAIRYALNCYDLSLDGQWERKSVIVLYMDFTIDVLQLIVYFAFFVSLMAHYGIPLHLVRQIYVTFNSFWKRVVSLNRYIKVTADIDTRFPEATPEQLQGADVCAVCLMQMETGRVLRCGHMCHRRCLLTWFERSQSCPMCRESVLDDDQPNRQQQLNQQQLMQFYAQFNPQNAQFNPQNAQFNNLPPQIQPIPQPAQPAQPAQPLALPQNAPQNVTAPQNPPRPSGSSVPSNERVQRIMDSVFRLQEQMVDMQLELQQLHDALREHIDQEAQANLSSGPAQNPSGN